MQHQAVRTRKQRHNATTINTLASAQPQACWFSKPSRNSCGAMPAQQFAAMMMGKFVMFSGGQ